MWQWGFMSLFKSCSRRSASNVLNILIFGSKLHTYNYGLDVDALKKL